MPGPFGARIYVSFSERLRHKEEEIKEWQSVAPRFYRSVDHLKLLIGRKYIKRKLNDAISSALPIGKSTLPVHVFQILVAPRDLITRLRKSKNNVE